MNPWTCATLIALPGASGGVINALLPDPGFVRASRVSCVSFQDSSRTFLSAHSLLSRHGPFTDRAQLLI